MAQLTTQRSAWVIGFIAISYVSLDGFRALGLSTTRAAFGFFRLTPAENPELDRLDMSDIFRALVLAPLVLWSWGGEKGAHTPPVVPTSQTTSYGVHTLGKSVKSTNALHLLLPLLLAFPVRSQLF